MSDKRKHNSACNKRSYTSKIQLNEKAKHSSSLKKRKQMTLAGTQCAPCEATTVAGHGKLRPRLQ